MDRKRGENQLKVCCTCAYWSYKFKGFCHRLEQGVGKFWICEDWQAVSAEADEGLADSKDQVIFPTFRT